MQTCNTSQQRDQSEIQHAIGGYGSGGGGGDGDGYDIMRQSAMCLILNKIYPNIAKNDLQLIDIK
jgi:hypothetical protein